MTLTTQLLTLADLTPHEERFCECCGQEVEPRVYDDEELEAEITYICKNGPCPLFGAHQEGLKESQQREAWLFGSEFCP